MVSRLGKTCFSLHDCTFTRSQWTNVVSAAGFAIPKQWFGRPWARHGAPGQPPGRFFCPSGRPKAELAIPKPVFPHGVCGRKGLRSCVFYIRFVRENLVWISKTMLRALGRCRLSAKVYFGFMKYGFSNRKTVFFNSGLCF